MNSNHDAKAIFQYHLQTQIKPIKLSHGGQIKIYMKCVKMHGDGNYMNLNLQKNLSPNNKNNKDIFFIVPAFNEASTIEAVINSIIEYGFTPVVIDDCSSDQTANLAFNCGATVIRHPINLGQGAALQTGIEYCLTKNFKVLVTFDSDGQHQMKDAICLINSILNDEADIVCGSRFLGINAVGIPPVRSFFLKIAALYTRLSTGLPVTDAHNGLRALSKRAAQRIHLTHNRMAHASELMTQIKTLRFKELPVEIVYTEHSLAKGQKLSNSINILIELFIGKFTK
jgi:glycosyltransferase involved in cell wall biosynthesis